MLVGLQVKGVLEMEGQVIWKKDFIWIERSQDHVLQ
jgi:hypothetical protein